MNELNGGTKKLPGIVIVWDQETNGIGVQIDPFFKNHDMVLAVLGIAQRQIEDQRRMMVMAGMQQQAQEQAMAQAVRNTLKR